MLIHPTERAEHDRRVNNMSIRKVVAGLLIAAGIAIMAVPFFWRATGAIKPSMAFFAAFV